MSRKLWKPTPDILARITQLKLEGATDKAIAADLGIRWETFARKKAEFPEIVEAIERVRREVASEIAAKALRDAPPMPLEIEARKMLLGMEKESRKWKRFERRLSRYDVD